MVGRVIPDVRVGDGHERGAVVDGILLAPSVAVFDGRVRWMAWAERLLYRLLGTSQERTQS